jgi:hypothetical protein
VHGPDRCIIAARGVAVTELAMLSTSGTDFAEVDPSSRIMAVRAEGSEAEILGRHEKSGAEERLRIAPTEAELGWVTTPPNVVWTRFRTTREGCSCHVELAPL